MTLQDLPALNASLNALSTFFIVVGLILIKADRKQAHIVAMSAALVTSALFLTSYLIYHFNVTGVTRFTHPGWPRRIYFFILLTHIPLAAITVPLVLLTIIPALRARYDAHRRIARWTWPIWLYVSVTGVLVYLMLYVWYPAS
jgi:putative membrane protein